MQKSTSVNPKPRIVFTDLGAMSFGEAWKYQENLFHDRVQNKLLNRQKAADNQTTLDNYLLFVEHPHVYTLGKSGTDNNLLISEEFLKKIKASFYRIDRGGDITYHGPGQLVGYPIFDLDQFKIPLKQYVFSLEACVIICLEHFGIKAERLAGATGVWIESQSKKARKICAIGVKASRQITMHGFALNLNTDLSYFSHINPCGFIDKGVTSLQQELGQSVNMSEVKIQLKNTIIEYFHALKD